ncbi:MAG: glycine zipper family protein [Polyangiaceae bacterium]|nr:glycine zipper family protein [Polyangiaceae bacterium]
MTEVLGVLFSFPSVVFTLMSTIALLYWLLVIVGAADIDSFGGAKEGLMEGAVKGAVEGLAGAAKGGAEAAVGAMKGGAEGIAGGDGGADGLVGDGPDLDAGFLSFLRVKPVPVTVIFSVFSLFGLLLSGLYSLTFRHPGTLVGTGVLAGSAVLSYVLTSFAVRPLAPLFKGNVAKKSVDFVGKIATINTGRVSDRFGQALLEDGGAGLILEVRDPSPNDLKRGDRVVLVHWDAEKEAFEVSKMPDDILPSNTRVGMGSEEAAMLEADEASDVRANQRTS